MYECIKWVGKIMWVFCADLRIFNHLALLINPVTSCKSNAHG